MAKSAVKPVKMEKSDSSEAIIGIIPEIYRGKTFGGKELYNVIVSGRSITFAVLTPAATGPALKRYAGKQAADIVSENKKNFTIGRDEITSFKFTPGHSYTDCCLKLQEIDGELEIITPKAKYAFYVPFRRTDIARDVFERAGLFSPSAPLGQPGEKYPAG